MAHYIAEFLIHFVLFSGFYAWGYYKGKKVNDITIEDAINKQIELEKSTEQDKPIRVAVPAQGTKVGTGDFQTIPTRDAQIKQLFDELDAMQHRIDTLTEKVDQLVADMEDIARVFGAEGR